MTATPASGPVVCECDRVLVDDLDGTHVVVEGFAIPFRRHTDRLVCPVCLRSYAIADVRAARGLA